MVAGGILGGELFVDVSPNLAGFTEKLTAGLSGVTAGEGVTGFLSKGIAVAAAVGAVAVTKMALDFEDAFVRIDAASNASTEDINRWKGEVLDLAGETAQAPMELADALYFLASAGLSAGQVTDTLEASAKASAVGLGDTGDIARLTANALNAYAGTGLTAVQVTDDLVAAIKAGTAEPDEFADALGRVLPIASAAGVGFDQVTASLAALSNIGLDVSEGVTALRGLLQAIVAPGKEAGRTLAGLGISTSELRNTLEEDGLPAALDLLTEATGGNLDVLRKIIPNIRALTGELGLTGKNAEQVAKIFADVANSQGELAEAFQTTTEGPMFAFRQAAAQAQVAFIRLGEALLPVAQLVAGVLVEGLSQLGGVIGANTDLIRNLVIAFVGFKAVTFLPTLLSGVYGSLVSLAGVGLTAISNGLFSIALGLEAVGATRAASSLTNVAAALPGLASAITGIGLLAAGLAIEYNILSNSSNDLKEESAKLVDGLLDQQGSLALLRENLGLTAAEFQRWMIDVRTGSADLSGASLALTKYTQATDGVLQSILDIRTNTIGGSASLNALTGEVTLSVTAAATAYDLFADTLTNSVDLTNAEKLALAGQIQTFVALGGKLNQHKVLMLNNAIAAGKFASTTALLDDAIAKLAPTLNETGEAADGVSETFLDVFERGSQLAEGIGLSFGELQTAVNAAIVQDGGAIGENFDKLVGDITAKVRELHDNILGAVNLTNDALDGLGEGALKNPEKLLQAFNEGADATRAFGRDLTEIAKVGGKTGDALVKKLLEMGDAGVTAADTIAGSSDKMRDHLIAAFGRGETAAERVANKLTTQLAGAIKDIRSLLIGISKAWDIPINLKDHATGPLTDINRLLDEFEGTRYATVIIKQHQVPPFAAGTDDFPGVGLVGERGPELLVAPPHSRIIPNDKLRSVASSSQARGGTMVVDADIRIANWREGTGRMRGIAREEDAAEARYRRNLGRRSRDDD